MSRDLYAEIHHHFGSVQPDRRGWTHVECPFCGAEPNPNRPAFSFNRKGWNCFKCDGDHIQKKNLKSLAQRIGLWTDAAQDRPAATYIPPAPVPEPEPEPEPAWKINAEQLVTYYCQHPKRMQLWQSYKPLAEETIIEHNFGVGTLPMQNELRLIVPLYWNGEIVGLKGRALPGSKSEVKWISARGSNVNMLWGLDRVPYNTRMLFICENYVDAALVKQFTGYDAVSGGGARTLTLEEMYSIVSLHPANVVVAYDNDLVGTAKPELRAKLEAEWRENWRKRNPDKTRIPNPPQSNAFRLATDLLKFGVRARPFPWPDDAPHKADVMWALQQQV